MRAFHSGGHAHITYEQADFSVDRMGKVTPDTIS